MVAKEVVVKVDEVAQEDEVVAQDKVMVVQVDEDANYKEVIYIGSKDISRAMYHSHTDTHTDINQSLPR